MLSREEILERLRTSDGAPVCDGQLVGDLDLRGRVIDVPLNLSGARVTGRVDLTGAELRRGLAAMGTFFEAGLTARRCQVAGDVYLSHARFAGPVDMSWTRVAGRVYAWRARFLGEATFRQLMVSPNDGNERSFVHAGELNFSWAWFQGRTAFERCHLEGPVYFWRTRFLDSCSFDESSFGSDATFMGKPTEICLSRREVGWDFFTRLEKLGLVRRDDEESALVNGNELAMFGQLADIGSLQELQQRMEAAGLPPQEQQAIESQYREHSGPMFAKEASFRPVRIAKPRQVKFIAVNGLEWNLEGTDVGAIAFFNADQDPVPPAVGLGHAYDRVFISYGGPDQPVAGRFNVALQNVGVETYYYPERAVPGRMIDDEMRVGVAGHDRVLLLCSSTASNRPGWLFELERALEREEKEGPGKVLSVLAIDDGLWEEWQPDIEPLRQQLLKRNVADFRGTLDDPSGFNQQLGRVLEGIRQA